MTPSQSEGLDGCEQPQGLPGLKFNHSLELAVLVRALGIKLLLISDVLPNLFLKSNSRDRIASCPKLLPIKIPSPCSKLPSHRNCRFPLEVSNHLSNGVLWGNPYYSKFTGSTSRNIIYLAFSMDYGSRGKIMEFTRN